ncbi:MAG TPA: hypothetical protein VMF03_18705 [Steroidobacteraceae bacterium]|nr:hypothetical protein [Steroidobacteraceae bacterium]
MTDLKEQDSHAAGSGSSTGDPGNARGTRHPVQQPGAPADDHIESPVPPPAPVQPPPAVR